jgi:hypothetical protein
MKARRDRMPQNEGYYRDGLREGKQEGKLEVTRKALAEGVAPEMVSTRTGLDMETIRGP